MSEAHRREQWQHTSFLLAMIHNSGMASGTPAKPSDFDPFAKPAKDDDDDVVVPFEALRVLCDPSAIRHR